VTIYSFSVQGRLQATIHEAERLKANAPTMTRNQINNQLVLLESQLETLRNLFDGNLITVEAP